MDEHELIQSLLEELRAMHGKVPGYEYLSPQKMQGLVRIATLDPQFMEAGCYATSVDPILQQAIGWTEEALRQEIALINHWKEMQSELRATLRGVSAAILKRRHRLGVAILQVYALLEQIARNPQYSHLYPALEAMKRHNHFGRKRRRKPPQEEEEAPSE